ncbi:MAG TPA: dephospho-CoA kinase, partial [Firmicutes bacterium]|nr:dephospho-CoA kinase [Bacillota bacterium]
MGKSLVIGLTGGIGTGKTTVAQILKELGIKVIHADEIGHQ